MIYPNGNHAPIIELRKVVRTYQTGNNVFKALDGIDLVIKAGEFTAEDSIHSMSA